MASCINLTKVLLAKVVSNANLSPALHLYREVVDNWMFIDNSGTPYKEISQSVSGKVEIYNIILWNKIRLENE